jgi:23S rRNA pseudouridine2457 synthase
VLCQFSREPESCQRTLADFAFPTGVYPVGRLDCDSEGLLLLSDDGRLNELLLHPKNEHRRTYYAQVERLPGAEALARLAGGIILEGRKTLPSEARILESEPDLPARQKAIRFRKNVPTVWLAITLYEGRNRQVRRMTAAVGHPTVRLVRFSIGSLSLLSLGLSAGEWKVLRAFELAGCFE